MITKILSLTVAALMFCSFTVFAVESSNAQEKVSTTSGGVKKSEPQSVKKNVPASQNTKKTVSPAKSAQNTKKPVSTNKNMQNTKKQATTVKKQTAPAKKQTTTAKKATNTKQKSTAKNTQKNTAKKPQTTNNNVKKATPQKAVVKKAAPAPMPSKQTSPKAPIVINATVLPKVTPQATILDRPLSQADLKYSSLLSQAQFAYEQKDYRQAIAVMNQAYEIKQEPFVAGNIATLYMLMGDAANCVRMVRTMKVTDPSVVSGLILGLVDRGMLYYAKNIAELTETVRDDGSVAYAKGVMYERLREPKTAEQYYRRAVMMSAHNASYVYALARINDVLKNYEKALTLYEDVLALTKRGELYGHSVSRIDELKQALKIGE